LSVSHYSIFIGIIKAKPLGNLEFYENSCKWLRGKGLRRRRPGPAALSPLAALTYVNVMAKKENTSHPHNNVTSALALTTAISHLLPSCFITVRPATIDQFLYSLAVGYCGIFYSLELAALT